MTQQAGWRRTIAANVRAERARAGLSQQEVADRMTQLGYTWFGQTVGMVERAERRLQVEEALALAVIFKCPLVTLMEVPR